MVCYSNSSRFFLIHFFLFFQKIQIMKLFMMVYVSIKYRCPIMIHSHAVLMFLKPANHEILLLQWSSQVCLKCIIRLVFFIIWLEPISQARITCTNPCAIEKKTATLICDASGLPAPKYLWFYGSVGFWFNITEEKSLSKSRQKN